MYIMNIDNLNLMISHSASRGLIYRSESRLFQIRCSFADVPSECSSYLKLYILLPDTHFLGRSQSGKVDHNLLLGANGMQ